MSTNETYNGKSLEEIRKLFLDAEHADYFQNRNHAMADLAAIRAVAKAVAGEQDARIKALEDVAKTVIQCGKLAGVNARIGDNDPFANMVGLALAAMTPLPAEVETP